MKGEMTPLHLAAFNASQPVVQTLVEMGADVEAKDSCLHTPLHLAAGSISDNGAFTVEYLVQNQAEVNVADKLGFTPLHTAASKGLDQVVEILVDAGADVDRPDLKGRNALHLAVLTHSEITVKVSLHLSQPC
ncbi:Ankyrin repeat protein [Trichostrongylus colubriformis]|uniref:Ankyrin repeat protein n=1 Tax=Trichostrongylus colubriformis TaxID=6319 RepID=A0AAN8FDP3_TRICO